MSSGVKVYSCADGSGYGMAAVAYVRGLLNAGVPVHWVPLAYQGQQVVALARGPRGTVRASRPGSRPA
jgi:hypothetical protein